MLNVVDFLNSLPKTNNLGEKITVVGATKMVDPNVICQAVSLGLCEIGENKAQEFNQKFDLYPPAKYHFIGHLQTNKVKFIVGKAHLIQSVDSLKLLEVINEQAKKLNITQNILLEVNPTKDPDKHGFYQEDLFGAASKACNLTNVNLQGLMTVLPKCENQDKLGAVCLQMRSLYDIMIKQGYKLTYLSMGMTSDYKIAIENGSNMIRIGSAIFGNRNYSK